MGDSQIVWREQRRGAWSALTWQAKPFWITII